MSTETMAPPEQKVEEVSTFGRIIGVFTSPGKTFSSIDVKPGWIVPVLVSVVVSVVFMSLAGDIVVKAQMETQIEGMEDQGMTAEQIEQAVTIGTYFGYGMSVVLPFLAVIVVSAVFMFVGNVILGGKTDFKKLMSVTAHSWLTLSLGALLTLPLVLSKQNAYVNFSLASLMDDKGASTFLYQLLFRVDVFAIWCIAVYAIGLGTIYKMKTQKMATAIVVVYLLYTLGVAGLTSLSA
ncbi:YIP1 family protein [bacterium]|nr:YIP1 family protein [bacterium]